MQKPIIQMINDIITRNNINVSQVSKLIGMPQNTLSRQLNGVSSLQLDTVLSICEYFNEDVYWLLTGRSEIQKDVVSSDVTPRNEVDYKEKYYNALEELVGAGAGLNKNLTTHVARHTYATYLLNRNIPIETVSRCMGHANIRMTQNYARMLGKKVINDMQVLLK